MKVLDATYLIDYLYGMESTRAFYEDNDGDEVRWIAPVPALAEVLVGEGTLPNGDVDGVGIPNISTGGGRRRAQTPPASPLQSIGRR